MKKSVAPKTALYVIISVVLAAIVAMALLIYLPAFTAYADGEDVDVITTDCIKIAPSDLEHSAYAGSTSIVVKDLDTDNVMFYLPESYFLTNVEHRRIAAANFDYYSFSYMGLDTSKWYVEYNASTTVQTVTLKVDENPYPDVLLTLKDGGETIWLDGSNPLTNDYTIKFIGFNATGDEFYVSATKDGLTKFTMVDRLLFVESNIPYQARTQAEREKLLEEIAKTPKTGDIVPNTSKILRIILIIGICIPAALIVFLLFKPSKGSRRQSVSRERARDEFDYDNSRSYRNDDRDYRNDRRDDRDRDRDYRDQRCDDRDYRDNRDYRDSRDYRDDRRY